MTTSDTIHELATALAKAQASMGGAVKSAANPFFKSKYADLASVWDACREPLTTNGLSVVQSPSADGARVFVETLLLHTSGQWIRDIVSVTAKDDSPQAIGSAITYCRRYALQSFAGVAPEDDDAEAAQGRPKNGNGIAKAVVPPEPEGYAAWRSVFDGVAKDGSEALRQAWVHSKEEYRDYLTRYGGGTEPLKARAVQADKIKAAVASHGAKKAAWAEPA